MPRANNGGIHIPIRGGNGVLTDPHGGAGGSKNSKTMSVDIYSCKTNNLARAHMEERVFGGWLD